MKSLSTGKMWLFATGQFGWSLLSGLISNWLVYFYQPDEASIAQGQILFIPQGLVILGIFTVIGGITAFGRLFDAFTDPWIAITMFQTGLPFFVTSLLKLPETMTTIYFVGMTALSLVFYIPINKLAPELGKKKLILAAFAIFALSYLYTGFLGRVSVIPANVQGLILMVVASLPMAVFGILPQAVVADIAQSDAKRTGSNREGMFYAARTFAFKL